MRRTSAGKLLCAIGDERPWAMIPCDGCPSIGITILATSVNENGARERAFCSPTCATASGWPWLASRERGTP